MSAELSNILKENDIKKTDAYIYVDEFFRVVEYSGDLMKFGIKTIHSGELLTNSISYFTGILPVMQKHFLLRFVKFPGGKSADIHIIKDKNNYWIFFVDVEKEEQEKVEFHQNINNRVLSKLTN
ncbi:MAG: hypothetical protein PHR06_12345 [Candidatus Cloacimonetes bacterium]|nr:hypothetical protein [Candidatus Cloacimonadota bacterium]